MALLVAILLVALGTIIAAAMAYDNAMTARRAAATFDFDQALLTAEGAEALAAYGLQQTANENSPYIYPGQPWSQPLPPTEVIHGVMLQASLQDLQGRFNVNDLVEQDGNSPNLAAIAVFKRMLTMLELDPKYADYLVDWIDKNSTPLPDGAEDSVYMELDPPYRTPNLPITSISELMALPGFTRADFDKLSPYIVALPLGTKINLCSAKPQLLDALAGVVQFSNDPAEFEKQREAAGTCWPKVSDFLAGVNPNLRQQLQGLVEQTSSWFRLTSFVGEGSTEFAVYTTLFLGPNHQARPVMRSFTPN
ncbi:MAG: type II secretion system minor pseudopilin GspK [Steroidobacteraceae bacterium]